jgi:hypothetical protein
MGQRIKGFDKDTSKTLAIRQKFFHEPQKIKINSRIWPVRLRGESASLVAIAGKSFRTASMNSLVVMVFL